MRSYRCYVILWLNRCQVVVAERVSSGQARIDRKTADSQVRLHNYLSYRYQPYFRLLTGPAHHPSVRNLLRRGLFYPGVPYTQYLAATGWRGVHVGILHPRICRLLERWPEPRGVEIRGTGFLDRGDCGRSDHRFGCDLFAGGDCGADDSRQPCSELGFGGVPEPDHFAVHFYRQPGGAGWGDFE